MKWQPIETAPKDGFFLVCDMSEKPSERDASVSVVWMESDGILYVDVCECGVSVSYAHDASHWMPLPNLDEPS